MTWINYFRYYEQWAILLPLPCRWYYYHCIFLNFCWASSFLIGFTQDPLYTSLAMRLNGGELSHYGHAKMCRFLFSSFRVALVRMPRVRFDFDQNFLENKRFTRNAVELVRRCVPIIAWKDVSRSDKSTGVCLLLWNAEIEIFARVCFRLRIFVCA
jgi:hypothetical protein